MKHILSITLIAILLFSFSACKPDPKPVPASTVKTATPKAKKATKRAAKQKKRNKYPAINPNTSRKEPEILNQNKLSRSRMEAAKKMKADSTTNPSKK